MKLISRLLPAALFFVAFPCASSSAQDTCQSVCGGGSASCDAVCYWEGGAYSTCGEQGYPCCPRYNRSVLDDRLVTHNDYSCPQSYKKLVGYQQWVLYENQCGGPNLYACYFHDSTCVELVDYPEPAWCPYCGSYTDCFI